MLRLGIILVSIFWGVLSSSGVALAERRVALVVGNSAYKNAPELANPKNDASDMSAALKLLGIEVLEGIDLDKASLEQKIREFSETLQGADVGVFFYAGHGLQVNGNNYLVPVDAKLSTVAALEFEMVRLDAVQRLMETATKTNILFLDACRNNPLSRNLARALGTRAASIGRGLAAAESGVGTLISYSTQPGNVALDGKGRNSPYAGPLVKAIASSDEDLLSVLTGVRNEVLAATGDQQVPWENHALRSRFYFKLRNLIAAPVAAPTTSEVERAWELIGESENKDVLQGFRKQFGTSNPFYDSLAANRIATLEAAEDKRLAEIEVKKNADAVAKIAALQSVEQEKATAAANREGLIRDLQRELERVGCKPNSSGGSWDTKTKSAIAEFSRIVKISLPLDEPSNTALEVLSRQKGRVCPLKCGDGQVNLGDRCVDIEKPAPQKSARKGIPRRQETESRQLSPGTSSGPPGTAAGTPPGKYCPSNVVRPDGVSSQHAC